MANDDGILRVNRENLEEVAGSLTAFDEYVKHAITKATRVYVPFVVETSEGELRCEDGYLAVDARGYPYPIAKDEFERIYSPYEGS